MKTRITVTVIMISIICLLLCACGGGTLGEDELADRQPQTVSIYVCGAVENEGYYEINLGADYNELLGMAGLLTVSVPPTFSSSFVDGSVTNVIVSYTDGKNAHNVINVNSQLITNRFEVDGLTSDVVNRLADYIEAHGKIGNRKQLGQALGDDYDDNYYKLFVAEIDYEID